LPKAFAFYQKAMAFFAFVFSYRQIEKPFASSQSKPSTFQKANGFHPKIHYSGTKQMLIKKLTG